MAVVKTDWLLRARLPGPRCGLKFADRHAQLVPRPVAVWGLVGYAIIFGGMVSELMGSGLGLVSSIPGGLWEVFIGVWLIVKGFNSSAIASQATRTSNLAVPMVP